MSNPYIDKKDLKKILDDYVFAKKDDENGGNSSFFGNSQNQNDFMGSNFANQNQNRFISNLINGENAFLTGLALGALGAYLLSNENAQKNLFKLVAKGSELFQAGLEEMKERFEDAKAELEDA